MKSFILLLLIVVQVACSAEGVHDVIRDVIGGNHDTEEAKDMARRAMTQSMGISKLADAFASKIGTSGATLQNGIFVPWYPKPKPISLQSDYVRNCLGYIPPVGKRHQSSVEKREGEMKAANRDFVFVLDTSGSVLGSEFEAAKEAIAALVEAFCPHKLSNEITPEGTKQVAVVLFGSAVTKVIDFADSTSSDMDDVVSKIMSIKHRREGMTSTASALKFVKESILGQGQSRVSNPQVSTDVIVITDGRCNSKCEKLAEEADAVRALGHGVNVFAVGVAAARECELDIISGKEPKSSFGLDGMNSFKLLAEAVVSKAEASSSKCV